MGTYVFLGLALDMSVDPLIRAAMGSSLCTKPTFDNFVERNPVGHPASAFQHLWVPMCA